MCVLSVGQPVRAEMMCRRPSVLLQNEQETIIARGVVSWGKHGRLRRSTSVANPSLPLSMVEPDEQNHGSTGALKIDLAIILWHFLS